LGAGAAFVYLNGQRSAEHAAVVRLLEEQRQAIESVRSSLARPIVIERDPAPPPAEAPISRLQGPEPPPSAPPPSEKTAEKAAEPVSPEARLAFQDAQSILDTAVVDGHWSERAKAEFRRLLPQMTPEDRFEATRRIAVAINQNKLVLDEPGPIY